MRNQPNKPTSADIARISGVSRSTVSRVINSYANVPEDTRKRVSSVIEQYGYVPSVSGKTLRGKRARCVGVFMSSEGWQDETQAGILYAFSQIAQSMGYMTLSGKLERFGTPACDGLVQRVLKSGCVDAGVFLNAMGGEVLIRQLLCEGQTIATFGLPPEQEHERLYTIGLNPNIARETVAFALAGGYRHAVLLGDPANYPDNGLWLEQFVRVASETGLRAEQLSQYDAYPCLRQAEAALSLVDRSGLLICTDPESAFAAYHAAYSHGLAVGRDVSILGMGLFPASMPLWPTLTAFRADAYEMMESLASRLIRSLEGERDLPRHAQIPFRRVEGQSFIRRPA